MKIRIQKLLEIAINRLNESCVFGNGILTTSMTPINIERVKEEKYGDFFSNIAMVLSHRLNRRPMELAQLIVDQIPTSDLIEKTAIASPGFINFYLTQNAYFTLIDDIRQFRDAYGKSTIGRGKRVSIEFVSANPTGPLHVGHGRAASYGDSLARVLKAAGYVTHSEYYINDTGKQMDTLAVSIWIRYLELYGHIISFPESGYCGEYIRDIAGSLKDQEGDTFCIPKSSLFDDLPSDNEHCMDSLILRCKYKLGSQFREIAKYGSEILVKDIRNDLEEFGVRFQEWSSESSLFAKGEIEKVIQILESNGHVYEKDGAKWFHSIKFGDKKDRVLIKSNGVYTYFASDIAHHRYKINQKFDQLVDIFGADHHGYVNRILSSLEALGHQKKVLSVLLVQFAVLHNGMKQIKMSTRKGDFITLRKLRKEVGNDAARFFYSLKKPDQHMSFDIHLAKLESCENPVYYVQYAHARICSVFRRLSENGLSPLIGAISTDYNLLSEKQELNLLKILSQFPEIVEFSARRYKPHQIAHYLMTLASAFHSYYDTHRFILNEKSIKLARLSLIDATRIVIANGLKLLGVSAPEKL